MRKNIICGTLVAGLVLTGCHKAVKRQNTDEAVTRADHYMTQEEKDYRRQEREYYRRRASAPGQALQQDITRRERTP